MAPMQGNTRYGGMRRLLAATLSLVLVLASVIGAFAHTSHNHHHHAAQTLDSDSALASAEGAGADLGNDHAPAGSKIGSEKGGCGDLLCHGGFAILSGQNLRFGFAGRSIHLLPLDYSGVGSGLPSLDRPPRAFVLA